MKTLVLVFFYCFYVVVARKFNDVEGINLECHGTSIANVSLTAYYPDYYEDDGDKKGYLDIRGKKLRTLQDFLDGRAEYVTLAMDDKLNIPYSTPACSPELNIHFGKRINLQVRDVSPDMKGKEYTRADICVRSEADSYDFAVNRLVTLVF